MRVHLGVVVLLLLCSLACSGGRTGASGKPVAVGRQPIDCVDLSAVDYTAIYEPARPKLPPTVDVTFVRMPSSADIEKTLRACIARTAATWDIGAEMLAMAWRDDEGPLSLPDGSSNLVYDPKTSAIQTSNEREGVKPIVSTAANRLYHVVYTEEKAAVPPYGKFALIDVVFVKAPSEDVTTQTLVKEIRSAVSRQSPRLNTTAFAKAGPRSNPAGQWQIAGANGKYISAEYDPKTDEVRTLSGNLLATIRYE